MPGAVRDEMDQDKINAKMATAEAQAETAAEIAESGQFEQPEFFDEFNQPED